ncbi:SGNH/GDSL hydrolase family protein [Marinicella sp. S1101]|uniref:SGNH/GDSL hydrolase family protein n=1 Tax=Marinicella marina TaxID=2996016 RepID=UPI002260FDE9|nr:SGNH/GDSL hydrolase family protein [Marinicella marina]MCX7553337.1 SGNH/GDSL hydrolase family protein [Marinicella marina]MDJ1139069.1 SGNH/GDSL hydrolase family protein [Marinicella marina]
MFKILFGPILLIQGWWVRHKTPVLPEPEIPAKGVKGKGRPLKLLLMGDSSAAGVGALVPEQSLLEQLLSQLCQRHQVKYLMLAETGRTTAQMIAILETSEASQFDVVITALGVNDVTSQVAVKAWVKQQQNLLSLLKAKHQPQLIIMSGLPPVGDFPALPWPLNAYLGAVADQMNVALEKICAEHAEVHFHSLRDYPDDAKAASDGFHPGPSTYQIWAERLAAQIIKSI